VVYNNTPGHVLKQRNISKQIALFANNQLKEGKCQNKNLDSEGLGKNG
jgi:hypothetical protein